MKNIQIKKIFKSSLLAFVMATTFGAVKAEDFRNCENRKSSIICQQSERQKIQSINFEISNNLTNFKLNQLINVKLPTKIDNISPTTNKTLVKNNNKNLQNYRTIRPKFINRNYEYAILALDQTGVDDLQQCVAAVDIDHYNRAISINTVNLQTAINLVKSLLKNSVEKKRTTDLSTKPSSMKCTQLFGLIFDSTFKI